MLGLALWYLVLGGIGFTMSLFIALLAFDGSPLIEAAKLGVLGGSAVAAVVGAILVRVRLALRRRPDDETVAGDQSRQAVSHPLIPLAFPPGGVALALR